MARALKGSADDIAEAERAKTCKQIVFSPILTVCLTGRSSLWTRSWRLETIWHICWNKMLQQMWQLQYCIGLLYEGGKVAPSIGAVSLTKMGVCSSTGTGMNRGFHWLHFPPTAVYILQQKLLYGFLHSLIGQRFRTKMTVAGTISDAIVVWRPGGMAAARRIGKRQNKLGRWQWQWAEAKAPKRPVCSNR